VGENLKIFDIIPLYRLHKSSFDISKWCQCSSVTTASMYNGF